MHLLVRETRTLDEAEAAFNPGVSTAELVLLSFSDSDLGAWAQAWSQARASTGSSRQDGKPPGLRLLRLAQLRHPMSVDLLVEQVIAHARCVVIRLLGGLECWRYGVEEVAAFCRARRIALVVVPGDGPDDPRMVECSTVEPALRRRLDGFLRQGGPRNAASAIALASHLAGLCQDDAALPEETPEAGLFDLPGLQAGLQENTRPLAVIVFYRSHLLCGDTEPITALAAALVARGLSVRAIFVSSLKQARAASFVSARLRAWRPAILLSATAFSARADQAGGSPLDAAGVPVLQLVLAVGAREAWQASARGLSQTDLAMQVVLPELDGRLLTTTISFKAEDACGGELDFIRIVNRADPAGIALAADRAAGWARLSATAPDARRLVVVLSDYPGLGGQIAHAVGLDAFASLHAILGRLHEHGYDTPAALGAPELTRALCCSPPAAFLTLADYVRLRRTLPDAANRALDAAWGDPACDPAVQHGAFTLRLLRAGRIVAVVQPDRGGTAGRREGYHDADTPPRHAFVAFHLWLRLELEAHAVVHLGTHGSLEWLPGKAAALSEECWPIGLMRGLPVIYPFIVNNPGEAAVAKRRLGAVTIGHLTPVMRSAGSGPAGDLERLIDEYAAADGLDRRRGAMLRGDILSQAESLGLLAESGAGAAANEDEALSRLDAWLCDVKDLQIRDGLHVFGTPPRDLAALARSIAAGSPDTEPAALERSLDGCAESEAQALLDALDGRRIDPGPAGAPSRGRLDVLPTGRNLFAIDPRAVPTRAAMVLAGRMAQLLLTQHRQETGEWLQSLVIDLWSSTTLRTGGEDLALALILMGAAPRWDEASGRVRGIEIVPGALLDRPRVDVTLRVSGLFRDCFEAQMTLFDEAVRLIAAREEDRELNPLAALAREAEAGQPPCRIYGPAPGAHGAGGEALLEGGDRDELGRAYLAASSTGYGRGCDGVRDAAGFANRVAASQALLHHQDHAETDLLEGLDYAAHEGGYAAAAALLGAAPALYHADSSRPKQLKLRSLHAEVTRVVRGRLSNPVWIAGMKPHGYRGAAEIARGLACLHAFARTVPQRFDAQYELVFAATMADPVTSRFLLEANPEAWSAMRMHFRDALAHALWKPRSNSAGAVLERALVDDPGVTVPA